MNTFSTKFKDFIISDDEKTITITHHIKREYKSESYGDYYSYTLDVFMNDNIKAYEFAKLHGMNNIIKYDYKEYIIITEMPYYIPLLKNIHLFDIYKFIQLIIYMQDNQIFSNDFAFRNIGIDTNGDYKLFDLSSLVTNVTDIDDYSVLYNKDTNTIYLNGNYYMELDLKKVDLQGVNIKYKV